MAEVINNRGIREVQLTEMEIKWLYHKWCLGYTQKELANSIGCSVSVVQYALHDKKKMKPILKAPFRYKGIKGGVK